MLTGRQKTEAAFSREGTQEFAAADTWEYVFIRDHGDQLTTAPWYDQYAPELKQRFLGSDQGRSPTIKARA